MSLQMATGSNDASPPEGKVISVDIEKTIHGSKQPVGKFIPKSFGVELITSDAVKYLDGDDNFYELIFEDTEHTYDMTKAIYELAVDRLVAGGVIISHDAAHPKFRGAVVNGIEATGIKPFVYLVEGDSCGVTVWQKPNEETFKGIDNIKPGWATPGVTGVVLEGETIQEKPKRKRRKKASKIKDNSPLHNVSKHLPPAKKISEMTAQEEREQRTHDRLDSMKSIAIEEV